MNINDFTQFIERQVQIKHDEVTAGQYKPTLVLGLGGTGCRILRQLKHHLVGNAATNIEIIGIDSDSAENEKYPYLPALDSNQLLLFNQQIAVDNLKRAAAGKSEFKSILDYLPGEYGALKDLHGYVRERIGGGTGAGQFRRAGKLLFRSNVTSGMKLKARLEEKRLSLTGLGTVLEREHVGVHVEKGVNIYVVCSIAGGTGAGCLIDALALLRMVFPEEEHQIIVLSILPGVALDRDLVGVNEPMNTRANAIGVLSEIQAIKKKHALPMEFVFDHNTKYTVENGSNFPNTFYLIDNKFYDGSPIDGFMDLTEAVGTFIYFLVGTGMGAHKESRRVNNGEVEPINMATETPPIFSALGIGFIEFPTQEVAAFAFLRGLNDWIDRWLASGDSAAGESIGENLITKLGLGKLSLLDSMIGLSSEYIPDLAGFPLGGRPQLMKCFDSRFFEITDRKMQGFKDDMPSHRKKIDSILAKRNEEAVQLLDKGFKAIYSENLGATINCLNGLKERTSALTKDLANERKRRESQRKDLEARKVVLADAINRKDLISDKAERNQYLNALTEEMGLLLAVECLPQRIDYVDKIGAWISDRLNAVEKLQADLVNFRQLLAKSVEEKKYKFYKPGIGSSVLPPKKYEEWCNGIVWPTQIPLKPEGLDVMTICYQVWAACSEVIRAKANAVNLTSQIARNDRDLQRMVEGLTKAGMPIMRLSPDAPDKERLAPQSFIAGFFNEEEEANKQFVKKHLKALAGDKPAIINTGNPHLLVCSQIFSGFAAAHWAEFEISEQYYRSTRDKPWYCGTFPVGVEAPPLRSLSKGEKEIHINFGLGLATEMIEQKGSNYYLNFETLEEATDDPRHRFATYRKERGAFGRALLEHALFQEARPSKSKPTQRLGEGITAALAAFHHDAAPQGASIREIFEDLARRKIGNVLATKMLLEWVETELVPEISKATDRRELLDSIAEELERYAQSLR